MTVTGREHTPRACARQGEEEMTQENWSSEGARLTAEAFEETTRFLPACGYELRLVHHEPESHRTISRYYTRAQLLGSVRYLRGMNREGYHVFFRPAAPHFVYVDDVSDDDIDAMLADGLRPVLVYQTSEGLRHAWFQLANRPEYVTEVEATMARKILAERYRGDRCATGKNQLGRLPGLRNVKPMHEDRDGGHPLVIIKRGVFAPVASTLLAEAKDRVAASPQLSPLPPRGRVFPCALNTDIDPSRSPMTPEEATTSTRPNSGIKPNGMAGACRPRKAYVAMPITPWSMASGFNTDMTPMTLLRYSCTQATRRQNVGWIM